MKTMGYRSDVRIVTSKKGYKVLDNYVKKYLRDHDKDRTWNLLKSPKIKKETPYTMQQKQVVPEQEVSTKECLSTEGNHTTLSEDKKETTKTKLKEELSLEKQHELQLQIDIPKLEEEELDFEEISEDILTLLPAEIIHEEEKTCEPKEEQLQELSDCILKEPIQEELTEEQLSDFSKLIALMQAENRQKEQVEEYISDIINPILEDNKELLGVKADINV